MKNLVNLIIKTALVLLVLIILIPIFGKSTWTQTLVTGIVLVALSYIIGDMWILPRFGNIVATVMDFGLVALVIWAMERALPRFVITRGGFWTIALVLAIGEMIFHLYLLSSRAYGKRSEPS